MSIVNSAKTLASAKNRGAGALVAGRYRLASKIGSGGMGTVWLAQDLSLDANCAIKLIEDDKATDAENRMRFEREAKVSAQLRSAHIVDVFDFGEWDGTYFIAMEYLKGESLSARLERLGGLDFETTYRIVAHAARALTYAHAQGIVHRDLKPENIFLVQGYDEEIAKVLDFGIAQNRNHVLETKATLVGAFLGTPCYVSPEQSRGKPIDYRTDLWSLGVIAFECLTGHLPFYSETLGDLMALILYEPIPKPTTFNADLPLGIDTWWERAAARDRTQRFQSAKEMADQLGQVLGIGTVVGVPTLQSRRRTSYPSINDQSGVIMAPAASAGAADFPIFDAARTKRSFVQSALRGKRKVSSVVAVAVLLVLIGVILGFWSRGRSVGPSQATNASLRSGEMASKVTSAAPNKSNATEPVTVTMLPLVPSDMQTRQSPRGNSRTATPSAIASGSRKRVSAPGEHSKDYGI
jgi:serine/threonine protein kinase